MPSGPTPTDRLLVGLSRLAPAAEDLDRIRGLSPGTVDWDELVRRAVREGVSPLVYHSLRPFGASVPPEALNTLRTRYYGNEIRNSRLYRGIAPLIGAVGAALLGMMLFGESASPMRLACIALIVAGIAGLKLSTPG